MNSLDYRQDIQGLRALAILLVIFAHAKISLFQGGFVGVDVFFVISGYLITGLLLTEQNNSGKINLLIFIGRRLKRLLPALLVMVSVTMIVSPFVLSSFEVLSQTGSAVYAVTWTSNFYFALSTFDYFSELNNRDLFLHTWSLGIEEQFYLVWPLFLIIAHHCFIGVKKKRVDRRKMIVLLLIILLSSFALSIYWAEFYPLWSFYLMPSRIWQFALGAIVFVVNDKQLYGKNPSVEPWLTPNVQRWFGILGFLLILLSGVLMHSSLSYPSYWALSPSLGAALLIFAGGRSLTGINKVFSHPIFVWLGDHSYSIYLWHWPLLLLGFSFGLEGNTFAVIGIICISIFLAIISRRFIELPFWKGRVSKYSTKKSVAFSLVAILICTISLNSYAGYIRSENKGLATGIAKSARGDVSNIYKHKCDTWYFDSTVIPCIVGSRKASKKVVLLGDSIGAQWFSLVSEIFSPPEWSVIVLTKSSCPIVDEDIFYKRIGKNYDICSDWRNKVLGFLSKITPDVIIIGSASTYSFTEKQWVDGSSRIFEKLSNITNRVIVIPGTPALPFNGPGCIERWYSNSNQNNKSNFTSSCGSEVRDKKIFNVSSYLEKAAEKFSNIQMLNLNDLVCPDNYCSAINKSGTAVFRDNQHLTDSFVRSQVPEVRERVKIFKEKKF